MHAGSFVALITDLHNVSRDAFEVTRLMFPIDHDLPHQPRPILTASKDIEQTIEIQKISDIINYQLSCMV